MDECCTLIPPTVLVAVLLYFFRRTIVSIIIYLFEINRQLAKHAGPQNISLRQQQTPISIISHEGAVGLY